MYTHRLFFHLFMSVFLVNCMNVPTHIGVDNSYSPAPDNLPDPPFTKRDDVIDVLFNSKVSDPYRWLESTTPEVKKWSELQNQRTRFYLDRIPIRNRIIDRLRQLNNYEKRSAPQYYGSRFFFWSRPIGVEKSIYYIGNSSNLDPKAILDPNKYKTPVSIDPNKTVPSWDGTKILFSERPNNADRNMLKVLDVDTGSVSTVDIIPNLLYGSVGWAKNSKGFFYVGYPSDTTLSSSEMISQAVVKYHSLGTSIDTDVIISQMMGVPDRVYFPSTSKDSDYLVILSGKLDMVNDVYIYNTSLSSSKMEPLITGDNADHKVIPYGNDFYVKTDSEAPRYRIIKVSPTKRDKKDWIEVVSENPQSKIEDFCIVGSHLIVHYLHNVCSELQIMSLDGKLITRVKLPGKGIVSELFGNSKSDSVYFTYESFNNPKEVFVLSLSSGTIQSVSKPNNSIDSNSIVVDQVFYPSKDGTLISMFLVHQKKLALNGSTPTWLAGYGGFNFSYVPFYSENLIYWVERGGLLAIPNIRGGGEYGAAWHYAGILEKKQNVFDDFVSAAEWLIERGYTKPEKIGIWGGSNGGLLVAAVMVQRPDLFGAVVSINPVIDMVRYPKYGTGKSWIAEYGNPEIIDQFRYLYQYSPYHNIRSNTKYPSLLLVSDEYDDRVDPLHARKFLAAVQWAQSSKKPILMRITRNAGHEGVDLLKERIEQSSDILAYLVNELGLQ
jgi:prolyl oligopeptidase